MEMSKQGIQASVFTYSATISACAKGKQWHRALGFFEGLQCWAK